MVRESGGAVIIEKLTDEERRWLESDPEFQKWDVRHKVLRIIDQLTEALAAANALLFEAADGHDGDPDGNIGVNLTRRIRAHLTGAAPATTRTEAEQWVLYAMADVPDEWLREPPALAYEEPFAAELARREGR